MKEQNILEEFLKADKSGYAVPAFNFNDIWDATAIIKAAEQEHAPVLLMAVPRVMEGIGLKIGAAMVNEAARDASVPVFLHLDHCTDVLYCKACVDTGFPSVMIDASSKSLKENIRSVKEVCEYAHKRGSCVEAELGRIFSNNEEGFYEGEDYLVQVEDAVTLVRETHVDYLAVGIGTAHGFYKGKPNIHFKRLREINEAINIPLVLHGGTGIPVEDLYKAIVNGIDKVNIGAALRYAYVMSLKSQLADAESTVHPLDIHIKAREAVKATVVDGIRSVRAAGKA